MDIVEFYAAKLGKSASEVFQASAFVRLPDGDGRERLITARWDEGVLGPEPIEADLAVIDAMPEPPAPPPAAPTSCTRLGLKRAFDELGLWSKVKAMIASNEDMQEEWDLATELKVSDPIVQKAIAGLALIGVPLTSDQVTQLMIRANALVA